MACLRLTITVGTTLTGCPPYRSGRALVSASGSYRRLGGGEASVRKGMEHVGWK